MKDFYPPYDTVPRQWLVPPAQQPEYLDAGDLGPGPTFNLTDYLVDRHVRAGRGGHVAIHAFEQDASYTYAQLADASARLARGLRARGVQAGDRVAVRFPNRPQAAIAFLAAWRIGAIGVLVPATARRDEVKFFLNDTLAKVVVVANSGEYIAEFAAIPAEQVPSVSLVVAYPDAEGTEYTSWAELCSDAGRPGRARPEELEPDDGELDEWAAFPPDALAVIWHTGGTTGTPKACYHTVRRLVLAAERAMDGYDVTDDDVHLFPAPVGHAAGWLSRLTFSMVRGITQVEIENFSNPENVLRAIQKHRVTWLIAMGASWSQMLPVYEKDPDSYDLSSIRKAYAPFITSNGEWLYRAWLKHGLRLLNPMGSTAFAAWFFIPWHAASEIPPMSVVAPVDGWTARLIVPGSDPLVDVAPGEVGQLAIRGVSGLTYWNRPELQIRDVREGWSVVDDLLRVDEQGFYHYMGRSDMMISPGGHKVAPVEVEQALSAHPCVAEVAVTGAPDRRLGETVMAWVVLADGYPASDELRAELQGFVKQRLAPYKYPRRIMFMTSLPRDPLGKIVMKTLVEWARTGEVPADAQPH